MLFVSYWYWFVVSNWFVVSKLVGTFSHVPDYLTAICLLSVPSVGSET